MSKEIKDKKLKETQLKDAKLSDDALDNVAGGFSFDVLSDEGNGYRPCLGEDSLKLNGIISREKITY